MTDWTMSLAGYSPVSVTQKGASEGDFIGPVRIALDLAKLVYDMQAKTDV